MYIELLLASFLGLPLGIALARIAPEEVDQYRAYLKAIMHLSVAAILWVLIYYSSEPVLAMPVAATVLYGIFSYLKKPHLAYAMLPFMLSASVAQGTYPETVASLVFLFGLPYGSIEYEDEGMRELKKKKRSAKRERKEAGREYLKVLTQAAKHNWWYFLGGAGAWIPIILTV